MFGWPFNVKSRNSSQHSDNILIFINIKTNNENKIAFRQSTYANRKVP